MDITTLLPLILAIVAIVPGVWALVNQANKDKTQAKIDMNNAANAAAVSIIAPLQAEVTRLQGRVLELEKALIEKTTEIGKLMEEGIDKDSEIRTMKYKMGEMQTKLDAVYGKRKPKPKAEDVVVSNNTLEEELESNESKKKEIKAHTDRIVSAIQESSIGNDTSESIEPENE